MRSNARALIFGASLFVAACGHEPADMIKPVDEVEAANPDVQPEAELPAKQAAPPSPAIVIIERPGLDTVLPDQEPPPAPGPDLGVLELRGGNLGTFVGAELALMSIEVTDATGAALPVVQGASTVDLANGQGFIAGTVVLPEGDQDLQVTLHFGGSGSFDDGVSAGAIDAVVPPLRFTAPSNLLRATGRALVEVDVARSLEPLEDGRRLFLPDLTIDFDSIPAQ